MFEIAKNTIAKNFNGYIVFIVVMNFCKNFSILEIFPSRFPGIFAKIFKRGMSQLKLYLPSTYHQENTTLNTSYHMKRDYDHYGKFPNDCHICKLFFVLQRIRTVDIEGKRVKLNIVSHYFNLSLPASPPARLLASLPLFISLHDTCVPFPFASSYLINVTCDS